MENLEGILAEHPFLKDLSKAHLALLAGCASNVVFKAGEFVFKTDGPADSFYFIRQGRVHVETHIPQKGAVTIQTRTDGEVFGWSWLVPPYRWHFDARAVELTRAVAMDGKCLRKKCEEDHDLGYELMKRFLMVVSQRLDATRLQLMDVYGHDTNKF
jgi:CRP/FNR family cyclic AMP-dependent transcriptional regulator